MSREIKFRSWHKGVKEMSYDDHLSPNMVHYFKAVPIIMMQFTGIIDCNGVDIYDGDIIMGEDGEKEIVSWAEQSTGWYPFASQIKSIRDVNKSVLVLGNIYQNPELLK